MRDLEYADCIFFTVPIGIEKSRRDAVSSEQILSDISFEGVVLRSKWTPSRETGERIRGVF
jgi:hypothetical protein